MSHDFRRIQEWIIRPGSGHHKGKCRGQQHDLLESLPKTSFDLINHSDLNDLLESILIYAGQLCGTDHGYLYLVAPDGDQIEIKMGIGGCRKDIGRKEKRGEGMSGKIWQTGRPIILDDYETWEGRSNDYPYGIQHACMGAPLTSGNQVIGIIGMAHVDATQKFGPEQLKVLDQFAHLASLVLEKVRSEETIQQELTERRRAEDAERQQRAFAEALLDTTAALNSTLSFAEVLDRILNNVGVVVPHDAANIMIVDEVSGIARVERAHGYAERGLTNTVMALRFVVADVVNLQSMAETGKAVVFADAQNFPGWVDLAETRWVKSYAGAPIRIRDQVVGFLNLDSATLGFFTEEHAQRLQVFANQAAIAIQNARLYAEVRRLAIVDELMGVYNRRGLFELGYREVERARRFNRPLSGIFLDVDRFKDVNDTYGHAVGDELLSSLAQLLRLGIRDIDLIGRYGGEEIVILLPENDRMIAEQVAERLRHTIEVAGLATSRGNLKVTISQGVVQLQESDASLADFIQRADRAMYAAKQAGRNCVVVG
jgi:eukaryotic-like serine/threonine-protein kinase